MRETLQIHLLRTLESLQMGDQTGAKQVNGTNQQTKEGIRGIIHYASLIREPNEDSWQGQLVQKASLPWHVPPRNNTIQSVNEHLI